MRSLFEEQQSRKSIIVHLPEYKGGGIRLPFLQCARHDVFLPYYSGFNADFAKKRANIGVLAGSSLKQRFFYHAAAETFFVVVKHAILPFGNRALSFGEFDFRRTVVT